MATMRKMMAEHLYDRGTPKRVNSRRKFREIRRRYMKQQSYFPRSDPLMIGNLRGEQCPPVFVPQRPILKHAYRRDEKLKPIQEELFILMMTRSSYPRSWSLLWRATKCSCRPGHLTGVADRSWELLHDPSYVLPVIIPEELAILTKDCNVLRNSRSSYRRRLHF